MHYLNTAFDYWGIVFQKRESMLLNHHIFVQSNKNEVLLIYCSCSFFLKDKILKKLAVTVKFLTVSSLKCFLLLLFACNNPCPLCKSSKTKNHLKPENLETLFLLSALKMPIKSVNSYQAEQKQNTQKMPNSSLTFRCYNCIFIFQHSDLLLFHGWK